MHESHPPLFRRLPKKKAKRRKAKRPASLAEMQNPLEEFEQEAVCDWLDAHHIPHHSIPNELGTQDHLYTIEPVKHTKMHRIGLKPGVPDLFICRPSQNYHGLYIEMKRRQGSVVSPQQKMWIQNLNAEGYLAVICKGADKAIRVLEDYFDLA